MKKHIAICFSQTQLNPPIRASKMPHSGQVQLHFPYKEISYGQPTK